jgi:glycosyltransferase involved in cell wall biosynthesis
MSFQHINLENHSRPKFSVVIPCWNAAATLRSTLDTILGQDYLSWETIIVDDGSTDETTSIIMDYVSKDKRFQILSSNRQGPSGARNLAALKCAQGEYIAFLDSDDLWAPNKLSSTLAFFETRPDADAVYAQISFFRISPLKPETHSTVYKRPLNPIDFLRDNPVCTMSNLVIKSRIFKKHGGFDESIVHNEDVEFLVRATANGAIIEGLDEHLVSYRTSITGLSANLSSMRKGWHKAIESLQATNYRLTPQQIAEADAGNLRYLARRALRTGAPGFEALRMAVLGISRSPKSFFSPLWRGGMTLAGALAAPFLTKSMRKIAFSR